MEVDPYADTLPPRYAIESDEEEEEFNPLHVVKPTTENTTVEAKILGELLSGGNLVVVSGEAGTIWAKGASLGGQTGAVYANNVQIGLAFNPSWTKSIVIISEALSGLPLYAMNPYAKHILESLQPKSLSLLDTYVVPTYSKDHAISFQEAPIRYLSTAEDTKFLEGKAELFSPPNLIQSTSASFLSILSVTSTPATVILLPSPHIPHPPPKQISTSNISHLTYDDVEWPTDLVNTAQSLLFKAVGENVDHAWKPLERKKKEKPSKRNTEVGEGGMYI
ncbi:hypothetical protein NLJ89_g11543 [Agrocybe chaxingu]|uniref:Uncharacterized protein n=1 Tax=Agrocybe chaxingu TaxID=84603 RepID=A0A9W8JLQ0_9AGAR|nr:hypothetical protein NLJ89_g11543 [Agrocybe chaxingu]